MPEKVFTPLRGKRMRVTTLDQCGRTPPPNSPAAQLVTDGFITLSLSAEVEDGTEIIQKKADGSLCVNERFASSFKRFNLEAEFCGVHPSLIAAISNARTYAGWDGSVIGFTVPEGDIVETFALELWTGLSGAACGADVDEASGYFLLPFVQSGVLGDMEIDGENAVNAKLTGSFTKGGNGWGVGPYAVSYSGVGTPAGLPTPLDPFDHLLMMETGLAPPPVMLDPAAAGQPPAQPVTTTTSTTTTVPPATTTTTTLKV